MDNNNISEKSDINNDFSQKKKNEPFFNKTWDQYVYTLSLIFISFAYAVVANLYGPAMVDFKYIFHTTLNAVSLNNVFRNIGNLLGALFGFIYSRINRQLAIGIFCCMQAIFGAALPFCSDLWQVYLCTTISMTGAAAFDTGANPWAVEIWGANSAAIMQLLKAANGLGIIVSPILDKSYLVGELKLNNLTQYNKNQTAIDQATDELNNSAYRNLKPPFLIAGIIGLPVPLVVLAMFVIKRYRTPTAEKSQVISDSKPELSSNVKYTLITLISISMSCYGAMQMIHLSYGATYYQDLPIHLSAQRAAEIMSVVSTTLTVGMLFSAFVSVKLKPEIMLIYSYVILGVSLLILYFGCNNEIAIWIGNGVTGFGHSAVWPTYFALIDNHIGLTNNVCSIILAAMAICPMFTPFILGPLIEKSPQIVLLAELVYFIISITFFVIIMIILRKSSRSLKNKDIHCLSNVNDSK